MQASDVETHESLVSVSAQQICVAPQATYTLAGGELTAVDLPRLMAVVRQLKTHQARFEVQAKRLQQLTEPPATSPDSGDGESEALLHRDRAAGSISSRPTDWS